MLVPRIRILIATLWVGSLWTVGYLVAPTLFATLADKVLAGTIAGSMFRIEAWLTVFCALVLVVLLLRSNRDQAHRTLLILTGTMLACTLIGYFGLQPFMASLRATAGVTGVMTQDAKMQFGILHGVASVIYLLESLLGVALVLKIR